MQEAYQLDRFSMPRDAWDQLDVQTQYSVLVLGHIFNEVNILQRMMGVSSPPNGATTTEQDAMVGQMIFFARMLAGKIYEAKLCINGPEVSAFLTHHCFTLMSDGEGVKLLKEFNRSVSKCKWLAEARNGHAMHYPTIDHMVRAMSAMKKGKMTYQFVMGHVIGDTYYASAETAANLSFILAAKETDWRVGLKRSVIETRQLCEALNDLVRSALNAYFDAQFDRPAKKEHRLRRKHVAKFSRPKLRDFSLPYFFDLT